MLLFLICILYVHIIVMFSYSCAGSPSAAPWCSASGQSRCARSALYHLFCISPYSSYLLFYVLLMYMLCVHIRFACFPSLFSLYLMFIDTLFVISCTIASRYFRFVLFCFCTVWPGSRKLVSTTFRGPTARGTLLLS